MIRSTRVVLLGVVLASTACGAAVSTLSEDPKTPGATRRDRYAITGEEIKEVPATNLYEVVQRLHPEWLTARSQGTVGGRNSTTASGQPGVQVYMDAQRLGNVEVLRQVAVTAAASLKYYTSSDAQAHFGTGNFSGAIQIISATTKR
jgi:hypothetical protein